MVSYYKAIPDRAICKNSFSAKNGKIKQNCHYLLIFTIFDLFLQLLPGDAIDVLSGDVLNLHCEEPEKPNISPAFTSIFNTCL